MTGEGDGRRGAMLASAAILAVVVIGWLVMPRIMLMVSGAGRFAGLAVALAFILAFFAVLWLRARYQRRHHGD